MCPLKPLQDPVQIWKAEGSCYQYMHNDRVSNIFRQLATDGNTRCPSVIHWVVIIDITVSQGTELS